MSDETVRIGLLGCGTVGKGVVRLLARTAEEIRRKSGLSLELAYIVELPAMIEALRGDADVPVSPDVFVDDADRVFADKSVGIVIELIGGYGIAKEMTLKALAAGKDVVTANKAMLAKFGKEVFAAARSAGTSVQFEASCGGGIPLVQSIQQGLVANEVRAIYGILNGTCNYILSEMHNGQKPYATALAEAQAEGFAEADPTLDVSGEDAAHKIAVLASLAFGVSVDFDQVSIEGISSIDLTELRAGDELGYVCKLLAIAEKRGERISLRVHPAFIRKEHPLAGVPGPFNAVSVYASQVGHTLYYGRGAGPSPTASAVVADVVEAAMGNARRRFQQPVYPDVTPPATYVPMGELEGRYYFRLQVEDRPGVMAEITRVFADQRIGLSAVVQHEAEAEAVDGVVPVVVLTHMAREGDVRDALTRIEQLAVVREKPVSIRLVEEPDEF